MYSRFLPALARVLNIFNRKKAWACSVEEAMIKLDFAKKKKKRENRKRKEENLLAIFLAILFWKMCLKLLGIYT